MSSVADDPNYGLAAPTDDFGDGGGSGFDDFDMDGVDAERIGSGSPDVDKPGWYHFIIDAKARPESFFADDMSKHRKPDILCNCTVLVSAPGQSPEGSLYRHNVVLGGKGPGVPIEKYDLEQTLNFLVGVGVLTKVNGRIIDPETGTAKLNTRTLERRLDRRQFIGKIEFVKSRDPQYKDKHELNWGRGAFQLTDPIVKNVPKHADYAALVLNPSGTTQSAGHNPRHQSQPPANAAPAPNPLLAADL